MVVRSEKTVESYNKLLKSIQSLVNVNDTTLDWLMDYKAVIPAIQHSSYSDNTKKLMFVAIKSRLRDSNDGKFQPILKFYDARMRDYAEQSKENEESQQLNPEESKKYIDWNTVLRVRDMLRKQMESMMEKNQDSVEFFHHVQNYVIVCLYTMIEPVRLDFADMAVVSKRPKTLEGNYLVWNKAPYFLFSKYKTAAKYGVVTRKVPGDLKDVITIWLSMNPTGYLLIDRAGSSMTDSALCQRVIAIFQKAIQKNVGVSQLRHSYITYMRDGEMPLKEQQEMAKHMMHDVQMSVKYRKLE